MSFKEVASLDCDTTISLGGVNKKLNKKNPLSVEGYYLGSKTIEDRKKKSGVSYIHVFQTATGNVGVWGKTDMDRKLKSVPAGTMSRVAFSGMRQTQNGDMYVYKVETDADNTIDVGDLSASAGTTSDYSNNTDDLDDTLTSEDLSEVAPDEVKYTPPTPPAKAAQTPSADRQRKVQELLASRRNTAAT
jgi:hypothetical protein